MNTKFIVDDYMLIWNLLFQTSIRETIYNLKQKLWETYKNEYNITFKDKKLILKDLKNFIPGDDTIYNIVLENDEYEKLRKQANKYRLEIMKIWDKNKKETTNLMKNMIRKKIDDYIFLVVNKELGIIEHPKNQILIVGKELDEREPLNILIEINKTIVENNIKKYKEEDKKFKDAIVELAVLNEYATKITRSSCYHKGNKELLTLKKWLYPYWLMYLGIPKEDFTSYMMRDKITFDASKYAYEKELKKMNIEQFIDFCIRNQRYIVREVKEKIN